VFELITIFLAVGLAFLAEDWREALGEHREERSALAGLRDEFRSNQEELTARLNLQDRIRSHVGALVSLLNSANADQSVAVPDSLLIALLTTATYNPDRGTVDALVNGGRVWLIRNQDLRRSVAAWPARLENALEFQRTQRDLVNEVMAPAFARSNVVLEQHWLATVQFFGGQVSRELRETRTVVPATAELRSVVGHRFQIADLTYNGLLSLQNHEQRLLALVEDELEER